MKRLKSFWGSVELLMATTIGAGMFSLPYVFKEAGWLTGLFYMAVTVSAVIFSHHLYWLSLEKAGEKKRLLGMTKEHLGTAAFYLAFLSVFAGLILILVAHLAIVSKFLMLALPKTGDWGILTFWMVASLPLLFDLRHIIETEIPGTVFIILIVLFVLFTANVGDFQGIQAVDFGNLFLPLGAVLFSFAGWTAIEPMFEWRKKNREGESLPALIYGTGLSALVYVVFIVGVFLSAGWITSDTVSGLYSWPAWKVAIVGWLGILALWVSYTPVSLEIKNELERDIKLPRIVSLLIPFFLPLVVFLYSHLSFISIISIVGGIFLAIQYIFIILVSKKVLHLSRTKKFFADLTMLLFLAAAVYEVWYFVLR